ncbi:Nucleolar Complex 2 protein [Diatrype stigma]|uniref:Nucleolar Complex 2 protein n=1 Tax=Diatrype stigma TaxID=117547 RepID=A0AAN9YRP6_9PEZI
MAGAKKNFKATKKFEQKHLKGVLEKRKASAKVKQRQQIKTKKQAKRSDDSEFLKGAEAGGSISKTNGTSKTPNVSDMSVDDFFGGGFEIIEKSQPGKKDSKQLGKRKRGEANGDDASSQQSDLEFSDEDVMPAASDDEAGDEDGEGIGMSKQAMDDLAKNDPDFYKFLKENDPEALEFNDTDLAEVDELSAGEDEEEEEQPKKKRKQDKKASKKGAHVEEEPAEDNELDLATVARWKASLSERKSLRAARQIVLAFRSAAHLNEDDEDEQKKQKYTISNPDVFHEVVMIALKEIPEVFQHHVPVKESAHGKVHVPTDSKKFKTLSMLLRSYISSTLHLLSTLSDDGTLKLTLSAITPLVPYLLSFRKLLKVVIKTVVGFWSQTTSSETTRITAFLVLRRLVVVGDKGVREVVLKATYQGLLAGSRVTNVNTIQGINLMKTSAAELWGIDQNIGYTTAFSFIRQLAIHLRNSIVHNKNDAYRAIYNWQYVHSLDFWSCVLSEHCNTLKEAEAGKESQLRLLIYPWVQVTLGAMRLIPTATYFPLRFHMIRSLLRLSRATGTYIPLASALLEVLNSAEMRKPPKAATLKALDFHVAYKAPKSYLRTRIYQDGVGEQIVELFGEYFVLWAKSIAFPEFALPVIIMLKRWLKQAAKKGPGGGGNSNGKLRSALAVLVQKLEANAKMVEAQRAKVDFAPRDRTQVDAFLRDLEWEKTPLGAYVAGQRKAAAERLRLVEAAREEDERKRREEEREKATLKDLDGDALSEEEELDGLEDEDEDMDEDAADGLSDDDDSE